MTSQQDGGVDNLSDYGSDVSINDEELFRLIDNASSHETPTPSFPNSQPDEGLRTPVVKRAVAHPQLPPPSDTLCEEHPSPASGKFSPSKFQTVWWQLWGLTEKRLEAISELPDQDIPQVDSDGKLKQDLTPLERFRRRRRGLTVTDLVSNIWCEQQYEYTLVRGYKVRTPKMKAGTEVHRKLEEEVHTIVPVSIETSEDKWGLKLFNMYQGLCSLEEDGITRELPVFGFLGGTYVSGIIDEVIYVDPTAGPTSNVTKPPTDRKNWRNPNPPALIDPDQHSLFQPSPKDERILFVSDSKTRGSKSLPGPSQVRASALQLMLYHRLLTMLRHHEVNFAQLLNHYHLYGDNLFSDAFLAGILQISPESLSDKIVKTTTLRTMWDLVQEQTQKTFDSVGKRMGITYRNQTDGAFMARQDVYHDDSRLNQHLDYTLKWWNGERQTVGVDIEEAWKCRSCEFEANCGWRLGKLEELNEKIAKRREAARQK